MEHLWQKWNKGDTEYNYQELFSFTQLNKRKNPVENAFVFAKDENIFKLINRYHEFNNDSLDLVESDES